MLGAAGCAASGRPERFEIGSNDTEEVIVTGPDGPEFENHVAMPHLLTGSYHLIAAMKFFGAQEPPPDDDTVDDDALNDDATDDDRVPRAAGQDRPATPGVPHRLADRRGRGRLDLGRE